LNITIPWYISLNIPLLSSYSIKFHLCLSSYYKIISHYYFPSLLLVSSIIIPFTSQYYPSYKHHMSCSYWI
jgi:hypothetical protein